MGLHLSKAQTAYIEVEKKVLEGIATNIKGMYDPSL